MAIASTTQRTIYQVSELNAMVRELLSQSFGLLWIEGEISNLARPRSGHVYFSLKDDGAQVRCALFRNRSRQLKFAPDNGDKVLVRARVGLYAARGEYQLIIEHMEPAGAGTLQRAFEQLKVKLEAEGLFDGSRKQAIPTIPKRIGVITSATGAAVRDVLSVLSRRYPLAAARIYPVPVQGEAAPGAIIRALQLAGRRTDCDVLLLVRGGGSLEDLQPFNDEAVARAITACRLPIITGVGHEVDVTIADFVADVRAPTPSAAAELVCPDLSAWRQQMTLASRRLRSHLRQCLDSHQRDCERLHARLLRQHPRRLLEDGGQRTDDVESRLMRSFFTRVETSHRQHNDLYVRLLRSAPKRKIKDLSATREMLARRLGQAIKRVAGDARQRCDNAARALHTASPLQTLDRGYAITRAADGSVLRDAAAVHPDDTVSVILRRGQLDCRVVAVSHADSKSSPFDQLPPPSPAATDSESST